MALFFSEASTPGYSRPAPPPAPCSTSLPRRAHLHTMSQSWLPPGYHLVGLDLNVKRPKYPLEVRIIAHDGADARLPRGEDLPVHCKGCHKEASFRLFVCCSPKHFAEWCALVSASITFDEPGAPHRSYFHFVPCRSRIVARGRITRTRPFCPTGGRSSLPW